MCFDKIEYRLGRPDAVNRNDLVTGLRATLQHVLEHTLLRIERFEEPGAGVQPDFADIARLRKVLIP
jgi:hypothetical protein